MTNEVSKTSGRKGRPPKAKADEAERIVNQVIESNGFDSIEEAAFVEPAIEHKVEKQEKTESKLVSESVKVEKKVEKKAEKKKFEPTDIVICRSVVSGHLFMDGIASSMPYTWLDFGDEVGVEYRDLVAAVRVKNNYIMKPFFVIMDSDFVAEYPFLKDVYSGQYTASDLARILTFPVDEMIDAIKQLPGNVKETLKGIASTWIANGKLDSFKKIKALDEILDTDLSLIADMYNE